MPITKPDAHHEHITTLCREFSVALAGFTPTKLGTCPEPDDVLALRDDLLDVFCRHLDPIVLAYGRYANDRTGYRVDLNLFRNQLAGALEGNALYEIEEAAQDIREQMETQNADDQYDAWRDAKMEQA